MNSITELGSMTETEEEKVKDMVEVEKDMANALIKEQNLTATKLPIENNGKFSIEDYAITFVYGMGKPQRDRFKKMLEQGIKCGESVAYNYGIDYDELIKEIKRILKVED